MDELVYDSVGELLTLVGTAVVSAALTVVGLLTEQAALRNVSAGHSMLGLWELLVGGLVLYVGLYLLGYQTFWQRLRDGSRDPA